MIPDLSEGISDIHTLEFYDKIAANLSDQSTIHINWFTHKRNPSVCWFCDQTILITKLIALCDKNITKSTVDEETVTMSENETDSEIENEGSVEPEYELTDVYTEDEDPEL